MAELLKETEEVLKTVVHILVDSQKGFQDIGDHINDPALKKFFLAESLKRAQFRGDLEDVLVKEGVWDAFKEGGTTAGTLHRKWGDLKAHLSSSDHTLLETAEQGEDVAKKAYKEALEKNLTTPVRQLLSEQAAHIQTSHDYVKAARDSGKNV